MTAQPAHEPILASRAARVTLVMSCLFAVNGVVLPFLSRWLEVERGLNGAEIGAILSLAQLARIVTGPLLGFWADGARDRGAPLRMLSLLGAGAYVAFFLLAHDFWSLLLLGFLALTLLQATGPFVEGAVLRATAEGKLSYGFARGIGSLSFIAANIAGGLLIARFGPGAVAIWVIAAMTTSAAAAWFGLKPEPVGETHAGTLSARLSTASDLLRSRRFLILVVACGLIQSGHAFYYGFSILVWRGQGIDAATAGALWAFAVIVEVAFLWSLPLIERRVSPEALILIGAAGAMLRWICMGFAPTGFALWPLQALHALSFTAAHVGAMRLLYRETPQSSAGLAQTIYGALSAGVLMGAATLLAGVLYDSGGAHGYWAMAGLAAAGGALALLLLAPKPRRAGV